MMNKRHTPSYSRKINLQENALKSMLVSLFLSSLRRAVPPSLHRTYLISSQNMEKERESLGMVNKHVGYVYLVDRNLKVRWAGCGKAAPGEADSLAKCTQVLLKRSSDSIAKPS
jgi:ATPase complex subunit ATP10